MKLYKILGVNCYHLNSVSDAKDFIKDFIDSDVGGYSLAINAEKIMMYPKDIGFRKIMDDSVLPIPDGSGATIGMKILYNIKSIKLDLPKTIFEIANENNFSLFILGATEKVNSKAKKVLIDKYPNINLLGRDNGYFRDESIVFDKIKKLSGITLLPLQ